MSKSKSAQIAAHLNAHNSKRPFDYRQIAEAKAAEINVGLYWAGTASTYSGPPEAEVWQVGPKAQWTRRLGTVRLCHDNIWR